MVILFTALLGKVLASHSNFLIIDSSYSHRTLFGKLWRKSLQAILYVFGLTTSWELLLANADLSSCGPSGIFWICNWHLASSFWPGWLPSFPSIILKLSNTCIYDFFFFWEMSKWELQKEKITVTSLYPQLSISLVNGLESFFYVCLRSVCVCVCAQVCGSFMALTLFKSSSCFELQNVPQSRIFFWLFPHY